MSTVHAPDNSLVPWLTYRQLVLGSLQALAIVCALAQWLIAPDTDNMVCVAMVTVTSSLMFQYLWHSEAMTDHPLSSLALLGFTASSQFVALVSQTVDLAPFIQYLRAPELTFGVLGVAHISAILAHFVYRHFTPLSGSSKFIAEKFYSPLNVHRIPTPTALWMLGGVGMLAMVAGGGGMGDVGGKFLAGMSFMAWMPFMLILYHDLLGKAYCNLKAQLPFVLGWALAIAILALARNNRGTMFIGPLQLCLVYLIYKCRGQQLVSRNFLKGLTIFSVTAALVLPSLSDLMLAMQITRDQRGSVPAMQTLEDTAEAFLDKPRLRALRNAAATQVKIEVFDELYLSNAMFARFTETKFHDNMLYFGRNFGDQEKAELLEHQWLRVIALIPQNILDALQIKLNKFTLSYSNGDFYLNQAYGGPLGSFVTGSMWADLYVLTGLWMPLVIVLILFAVFIMQDALTRFAPGMFISPIGLCSAYAIYQYGIGSESLVNKFSQLTRNNLQQVLLYALVMGLMAFVLQFFHRKACWTPPESA